MLNTLLVTDPMFGLPYARAAYLVIFGALFGYVAFLHLAHRSLTARLDELEKGLSSATDERRPAGP